MSGTMPEKRPGIAAAERGQVFLDGPDGVAVAMTPHAARETGKSLVVAADIAEDQSKDAPVAE